MTNKTQMGTGKTATDHNAFKYIAKVTLLPIDENTKRNFEIQPGEAGIF